ncbi:MULTISPECIES: 23S rRNA (pseudouridine(1915)-N(3))-methyltransferase RlmH [unclassified Prochlorococcus]|uniref:23S rRNA (pseudouridine(1915)-N(3))-methyltransferase RlmH n=1 Tax=unclassified Prochlorococcus TaxID=2627481 RepID=UPI000568A271|nr:MULTISPECIES: 23S rRNA (pseudouridine(1915)-N(3))-methyltransferase RlmH [unclassified Prochlorococcus]
MLNPSKYRIIAIGKVRKPWVQSAIKIYRKRLPGLSITEIRDSNPNKEAAAIRASLKHNELIIPLCEKGEALTSLAFSKRLQSFSSEYLAFIIGGANGLSPEIKSIAHSRLSLSTLTFPHEVARLLLIEQLYRAHTIALGGPYHRE